MPDVKQSDLEWLATDFFAALPANKITMVNAVSTPNGYSISPNGSVTFLIDLSKEEMFSCSFLKHVVLFDANAQVSADYTPKGYSLVKMKYTTVPESDNILVALRNAESVVQTINKQIDSITVKVVNNSLLPLNITSIQLFASKDYSVYQIAKVLKEEVISADLIQSTIAINKATLSQMFRTGVFTISALKELTEDTTADYIIAQYEHLSWMSDEISATQVEQFSIMVDGIPTPFWYTSIAPAEDAYQYVTPVPPDKKYPNISETNRNLFKYMVHKTISSAKKLSIEHMEMDDGKGGRAKIPVITLGTGSTSDPNSLKGKGRVYKDAVGLKVMQNTSDTGIDRGIAIDDKNVKVVNGGSFNSDVRSDTTAQFGIEYRDRHPLKQDRFVGRMWMIR